MISKWLPYDDTLDSFSRGEITNLLKTFLYIIPLVAVILAYVNFSLGLTQIALTILTVPIFCLISLMTLYRGMINLSVIILISILITATTLSCTLGNGIHETGIIVLPVIVLFSSLVMNVRGVVITTITVIICLAYIVFAEQFGLYQSGKIPAVRWVDLIVVQSVTIIHIFVTYSFSNITKKNLNRVQSELDNQKKYKNEIGENLKEKSELLRLVHHRVKNNLLLINSLIELETFGNPKEKETLAEITQSIHTIARAHDPLYHTDDYKQVAIKPYLEKLVAANIQSTGIDSYTVELEDRFLFHEKALLLGIILQKILSNINSSQKGEVFVKLDSIKNQINLSVTTLEEGQMSNVETSLIELLTEELEGTLEISKEEVKVSFREDLT
ncbi:histidine kinase dimerization/phosphoacceptor domain -containing protein [Ekhidna sp.]|uniref:histidine kinase dimerization/phosphoacceptor domain -containing protein n=1 Tax=Ekhidna sp. TaxID=2608089 RepID=UPI0032EAFFB0